VARFAKVFVLVSAVECGTLLSRRSNAATDQEATARVGQTNRQNLARGSKPLLLLWAAHEDHRRPHIPAPGGRDRTYTASPQTLALRSRTTHGPTRGGDRGWRSQPPGSARVGVEAIPHAQARSRCSSRRQSRVPRRPSTPSSTTRSTRSTRSPQQRALRTRREASAMRLRVSSPETTAPARLCPMVLDVSIVPMNNCCVWSRVPACSV